MQQIAQGIVQIVKVWRNRLGWWYRTDCPHIPNGQSRVIDLEKSVIVHVQPKKTAVEELVEACEKLEEGTQSGMCSGKPVCFVVGRSFADMRSALARVRQEGGV